MVVEAAGLRPQGPRGQRAEEEEEEEEEEEVLGEALVGVLGEVPTKVLGISLTDACKTVPAEAVDRKMQRLAAWVGLTV